RCGSFLKFKHRGAMDARESPNFRIFISHHHQRNLLIMKVKKIPGVEKACFLFITESCAS
ncbi:hypothetical protein KX513_28060, partial [Escherichia coli]|nr:hypothetical protein [Escherichia coli]